jgi:hypothetical protein
MRLPAEIRALVLAKAFQTSFTESICVPDQHLDLV